MRIGWSASARAARALTVGGSVVVVREAALVVVPVVAMEGAVTEEVVRAEAATEREIR